MFLGMIEPKSNETWQCPKYGRQYAEYVIGCPAKTSSDEDECVGNVRVVSVVDGE